MKRITLFIGLNLLGVCAYSADSASPNLHELMKNVVAVQTQVIWDTGNNAQDDQGNINPAKLTAADWAKIAAAASKVKRASESLATATHVMAAAPGQKIQDEGTPGAFGAAQVQKVIDAQPKLFSAFAQQLAGAMGEVSSAVKARDGHKLADVSGRIDEICEACHKQFWYPNQPK